MERHNPRCAVPGGRTVFSGRNVMIVLFEHNQTSYKTADAMLSEIGRAAGIYPHYLSSS